MSNNSSSTSDWTVGGVIGVIIVILVPVILIIWANNSSAPASTDTTETYMEYDEWKAEQRANENAEQEACIERMERDVERYGESVIETYNC